MAADTFSANGNTCRKAKKLFRVDGAVIGLSGHYADCWHFVRWWPKRKTEELTFRTFCDDDTPDVWALVYHHGVLEKWTQHCQPTPIYEPFFAIGSGCQAALAAMHMGASAEKAVQIASLVDPYTGGEIETIDGRPDV